MTGFDNASGSGRASFAWAEVIGDSGACRAIFFAAVCGLDDVTPGSCARYALLMTIEVASPSRRRRGPGKSYRDLESE